MMMDVLREEDIYMPNNNTINNNRRFSMQKRLSNVNIPPNSTTTEESYLIYSNISLSDCAENTNESVFHLNTNSTIPKSATYSSQQTATITQPTTQYSAANNLETASSYFLDPFDLFQEAPKRAMSTKFSDTFKRVVNSLLKENVLNYCKEYDLYLDNQDAFSTASSKRRASKAKIKPEWPDIQQVINAQQQLQQQQQQQQQQSNTQLQEQSVKSQKQSQKEAIKKKFLKKPPVKPSLKSRPPTVSSVSVAPESVATDNLNSHRNITKLHFDDNIKKDFIPVQRNQSVRMPVDQKKLTNITRAKSFQTAFIKKPILRPATTIERPKPNLDVPRKPSSKSQTGFYNGGVGGDNEDDNEFYYVSSSDLQIKVRSYDNFDEKAKQSQAQVQAPPQTPAPAPTQQQQQQSQQIQETESLSTLSSKPLKQMKRPHFYRKPAQPRWADIIVRAPHETEEPKKEEHVNDENKNKKDEHRSPRDEYVSQMFKIRRYDLNDPIELEKAKQDLFKRYSFVNDPSLRNKLASATFRIHSGTNRVTSFNESPRKQIDMTNKKAWL